MIVETVVDAMSTEHTAQIANALILMGMEQHALNNNNNSSIAGSATQDGLVMDIVMASITWTAKMSVNTVVDVTSTYNTAQICNALTPIKTGLGQLALNQQLIHTTTQTTQSTQDGFVLDIMMTSMTTCCNYDGGDCCVRP